MTINLAEGVGAQGHPDGDEDEFGDEDPFEDLEGLVAGAAGQRGEKDHGEEEDSEGGEGYAAASARNRGQGKTGRGAAGGKLACDTESEVVGDLKLRAGFEGAGSALFLRKFFDRTNGIGRQPV